MDLQHGTDDMQIDHILTLHQFLIVFEVDKPIKYIANCTLTITNKTFIDMKQSVTATSSVTLTMQLH